MTLRRRNSKGSMPRFRANSSRADSIPNNTCPSP
ncbi:Uncharacterised protein [Mycobacteroides abscessus subsp. abscessus]|nr:Uncharacterised protein [Mycobacteroides abscessus subsp. abscessus]